MPEELPKVDIDSPEDLDYFVQGVRAHARKILDQHVQEKNVPKENVPLLQRAIDQWLLNTQIQVEPNILVNGLSFADYARQPREMEDYDQRLEKRVQDLIQQVEDLTERAVECRKNAPAARVAALVRKQALLDAIAAEEAALEVKRLETLAGSASSSRRTAPERTDENMATLATSLQELSSLQKTMEAQRETAAAQVEAAARVGQLFNS